MSYGVFGPSMWFMRRMSTVPKESSRRESIVCVIWSTGEAFAHRDSNSGSLRGKERQLEERRRAWALQARRDS